jgi:crotonobetainyl-CoA:carnitine CoA-transferase CaiB-like acyl-CoA transferase
MDCDVSLYDTAISLLTYPATWHMTAGYAPGRTRRSAHPSLVPFQAFPAKDGWLIIACPKEKFWHRLVDVLDRPELANDPRFATFADRRQHHEELEDILDAVLGLRTVREWLTVLGAATVPCAPVNDVAQAMAEEHTIARDLIVTTEHPRFGTVKQVSSPVRVGQPPREHRRAPKLGEDTDHLLTAILDYDEAHLARLADQGAFGTSSPK